MSDPELATRAPENDALEDEPLNDEQTDNTSSKTALPADTPAQTGASMGEHCTTDRPTPVGSAPSGEITKINEIDVYISKPADYPHLPSKLLILLTGGTGLHSTNNQLQADRFASKGYLVVMPDMFGGDPAPNSSTTVANTNTSIIEQVKLRAAEGIKSFMIDMWLARHTDEKVLPIIDKVIEGAKEEFADAVASGSGVYGVGYCFGAKYIVQLCGAKSDTTGKVADEEAGNVEAEPLLKTGAIAHATAVTREDFTGAKSPLLLLCIENDNLFPDDIREAGEETLKANGVDYKLDIYPGVPHGELTCIYPQPVPY